MTPAELRLRLELYKQETYRRLLVKGIFFAVFFLAAFTILMTMTAKKYDVYVIMITCIGISVVVCMVFYFLVRLISDDLPSKLHLRCHGCNRSVAHEADMIDYKTGLCLHCNMPIIYIDDLIQSGSSMRYRKLYLFCISSFIRGEHKKELLKSIRSEFLDITEEELYPIMVSFGGEIRSTELSKLFKNYGWTALTPSEIERIRSNVNR